MARGQIAKEKVIAKIQQSFGSDWIGEDNKKYYVYADDGGEKVQIAISLTCPKSQVGTLDMNSAFGDGFDFSGKSTVVVPVSSEPAEITQEEKDNLAAMLAKLGL